MSAPRIRLWEHVGLGLIVSWPTGIVFTNQTMGNSCLHPEIEGVFVPLRNDCTIPERVLISPEKELWDYFIGPRWERSGAAQGLQDVDADFIDSLLKKNRLFPTISVDWSRLKDSHEAWVFVTISGDEPGDFPIFSRLAPYPRTRVMTWNNSA
jgi:hypothetical protein